MRPQAEHGAAGDPLPLIAAAFGAHANFDAALRAYTENFMVFRKRNLLMNKVISYHARWRVVGYLMYLDADRETFGAAGGATYARLLEMCGRPPEVSKRTLRTLLALLQFSGMITAQRDQADGRSKVYHPTARMQGFMTPWLVYATSTLDLLQPEKQRVKAFATDALFRERFLISMGRWHATETPLVERMPEWTAFFGGRDGANAILLTIMQAALDGIVVPSRATIGREFGISKSQVTGVLREGEALGYFITDRDGIPAATDRLREQFRAWVALELAFYALHMPSAL